MDTPTIVVITVLFALSVGAFSGYLVRVFVSGRRYDSAKREASVVLAKAEEKTRALGIEAREEALKVRSEAEAESKQRRNELAQLERRLSNREENAENRTTNLERRERSLNDKEKSIEEQQVELDGFKEDHLRRLEEVSQLSLTDAKEELILVARGEIDQELAVIYRDMEESAKAEATENARNVLAGAIQRLASDVVSEASLTTVPLPSDDMKGRLIGREGRNIRAIEKATGVDLIIDDTPEAVTLSCFDPIRREVARIAVTKLIADGRVHPARIEDMVSKAEIEVEETIRKTGEQAIMDVGARGLNPEIIKLVGRLRYRFSYGENVQQHCIEVGHLAGLMAAEIGANVKIAKTGGLLHDIGKALTHEVEGPHAEIGADIAVKTGVPESIVATIREHHDDDHSSVESFLVAAADAISAARPGARRDTVEQYIKRLEALESVARTFDGVEKCYAIQAGREVRIMVKPETIDDIAATNMARDVVKKIEDSLAYPGQIKVTVIRESRSVEYAR